MKSRLLLALFVATAPVITFNTQSGATTTPYTQMRTVIADIRGARSARVTSTLTVNGERLVNTTDAAAAEGKQTVTLTRAGTSNAVVVELIDGGLYVKGDEAILVTYMGLSKATATQLSDQWFTIPKTNSDYRAVVQGLTLSSIASELTMTRALTTLHKNTTVHGVKVDVIKGITVKTSLNPSVTEVMDFTTTMRPLPVLATQGFQGSEATITFSRWGEPLSVIVPAVKFRLN